MQKSLYFFDNFGNDSNQLALVVGTTGTISSSKDCHKLSLTCTCYQRDTTSLIENNHLHMVDYVSLTIIVCHLPLQKNVMIGPKKIKKIDY